MKKILVIVGLALLLGCLPVVSGAENPEGGTITISGKTNLEITGMTYDTLVLVNCFNVDIIDCSLKNLVLVRCWNIDLTNCRFVGEGVAVTADTSLAVDATGTTFTGSYSQKLMKMSSALINIK